jgi:hypothetical protein
VRFAFVPNLKLKHARVHYLEGSGSFRCISSADKKEICCDKAGQPKDRFVGLIFVYLNADKTTGKIPKDIAPEVAVRAIRLSRANFREISQLPEEDSNVHAIDIAMRHDDSRAFGYRFTAISRSARWRQIEQQAMSLVEPYKDGLKLASRLGKNLSKSELIALLGGKDAVAPMIALEELD